MNSKLITIAVIGLWIVNVYTLIKIKNFVDKTDKQISPITNFLGKIL